MFYFTVDKNNSKITHGFNFACNAGIMEMSLSPRSIGLYHYEDFNLIAIWNRDLVDDYLKLIKDMGFSFDYEIISNEDLKKDNHYKIIREKIVSDKYLKIYFPKIQGNNAANVFLGITLIRYLWYSYQCNWMYYIPQFTTKLRNQFKYMNPWDIMNLVHHYFSEEIFERNKFGDRSMHFHHAAGPSSYDLYPIYKTTKEDIDKLFEKTNEYFSINNFYNNLPSMGRIEGRLIFEEQLQFLGAIV